MSPTKSSELIKTAGPIWPPWPIDLHNNLMVFGFDVGDGWFEILQDCLRDLRSIRETGLAPNLILVQVKEKFGTLRVYVNGEDEGDIVQSILDYAETRSSWTCDECGKAGTKEGKGWIATRCQEHRSLHDYKRRNDSAAQA